MSYNSFNHPVQGISELQAQYVKEYGPGNYVPPVVVTYWAFRFMLGVAGAMAMLASAGLFLLWKKHLENNRWFLGLLIAGIFVPYIGNTAGWVLAEIGRQPWLVFGQLKTNAGVSVGVSPAVILFTLVTFIVLYGILAVVDAYLLVKTARRGMPAVEEAKESEQQEELPALVY
jgi:cytochrome d ubiquinol oxidase subunit I